MLWKSEAGVPESTKKCAAKAEVPKPEGLSTWSFPDAFSGINEHFYFICSTVDSLLLRLIRHRSRWTSQ